MNEDFKPYLVWGGHTLFLAVQAFLANLAQTTPKWAWLMPVLSVAQSTMPNPFSAKK